MQVSTILDNIERGGLALPMFQRGYVWTRPQVKKLMQSLYRGYPVGGLLVWETKADEVDIRTSEQVQASGAISLLLDGQQRVTSLYGIIRGKPPAFFDGNAQAFTDLYFNLKSEEFEFRSPVKMALDARWVSVTDLFERGATRRVRELSRSNAYTEEQLDEYQDKAQKIVNIRNTDFPVQSVTGEDKTTDVVVEIFNQVNSGGRKLSKGDLALSRIGSQWPEARDAMQQRLDKWESVGFSADRDWLLRCITAITTDAAEYEELANKSVSVSEIQQSLELIESAVDGLLEAARTYLGMDTNKVHNSKQAFPAMVKYLVNNGGNFPDDAAKAQLLHWYVSASIWGRFSGPTETIINQDLAALRTDDPIEGLRQNLIQSQGNRTVGPENFDFNRSSARFYPLLHIMSRAGGAKDWGTGRRLPEHEPSDDTVLELHHIFPKAYLRRKGFSTNDTNNFGNLAFQTRNTNLGIRDRAPAEETGTSNNPRPPYMPEIVENQPGALESQWVPNDPELWKVENYQKFLAERRRLLAEAADEFLASLRAGGLPTPMSGTIPTGLDADEEEAILNELNHFVGEQGLPAGALGYEIVDPDTAELTATLDLAWPNGLQEGLSEPVAVLIDEEKSVRIAANNAGFHRIYTAPEAFKHYVQQEILGEENQAETGAG